MNKSRTLFGLTLLLAVGARLVTIPATHASTPTRTSVMGGWIGELPCVFTSATPTPSRPTLLPISCTSGTTWDGDWAGHTHYVVAGTLDVVTGNFHGTIDETLIGMVTRSRAVGTLHLIGTVDLDGATNTLVVAESLAGGTGPFAGAGGNVTFEGVQASGVIGHGGYHGMWTQP